MGIGNPAADRSVKQYLANVREEQLKARVVPRQAEPFLVGDLVTISDFIHAQIQECANSQPSKIYILARDQAVFKYLFFGADRAADSLGLKAVDILRFPDNSGFLIKHIWTKSLRSAMLMLLLLGGMKTQLYAPLKVWKCISIFVGYSE